MIKELFRQSPDDKWPDIQESLNTLHYKIKRVESLQEQHSKLLTHQEIVKKNRKKPEDKL